MQLGSIHSESSHYTLSAQIFPLGYICCTTQIIVVCRRFTMIRAVTVKDAKQIVSVLA